jgi:hypothetical protein
MLQSVVHASVPASTDTYDSTHGLPRPSAITFAGGIACPTPTPSTISASASACASSTGNQASVPWRSGITHTWTIAGGGTITSSTTAKAITWTAPSSGSVTLTVTATDTCGGMASSSKTITIVQAPNATLTGSTTIVRGDSASLQITLTGTAPWTLNWSDGLVQTNVTTSPASRVVSPDQTTSYTVTASSGECQGATSGTAVITVIPAAPGLVTSTTQENRNVLVTWTAVGGANSYRIERAPQVGAAAAWQMTVTGTSYADVVPASSAPVTYIYYVRTIDQYGAISDRGAWDHATAATVLYAQPSIVAGTTLIQGADIGELRGAIDALRYAVYLPAAFGGSVPGSGVIMASDFTTLVTALNGARSTIGAGPFSYSGVPSPAPGEIVLGAHITQLREALR